MSARKDTIYIDNEDDITSIIDKVTSSKQKIVAIVPPKRSTVLQSIVNLKLLKKAVDEADKKLVIITGEAALLPLAASIKIHVADTLQSRPYVPKNEELDIDDTAIKDDGNIDVDESGDEKVEDDDSEDESKDDKKKDKKKQKIPNFQRFRMRLIIGGLVIIALIAGWFVGFVIMPNADVSVQAQTSRVPTDISFTADVNADVSDLETGVLVAQKETLKKTITEEFTPTGEKNVGNKASGSMTLSNCYSSVELTVPSGTSFTDPVTGFVYKSTSDVTLDGAVLVGPDCTPGTGDVSVQATQPGDDKNLGSRSYTVGGYGGDVTAAGGQMTGGSTEIKKVVSSDDVANAAKKLKERDHEVEKSELAAQFSDDLFAITESFVVSEGKASSQPAVGQAAEQATVSVEYTYTMLGVKAENLASLVEKDQKSKISEGQQSILENGINDATYSVDSFEKPDKITINLKTNGFAGPELDTRAIAESITNMKFSEAINKIKENPGVKDVFIEVNPFWVFNLPRNADKIEVNIEVSDNILQ